ncbi:hypothetical protein GUITHDRAFT_116600 [Guillardia theta CCMP2712]|uniref:Uncharacterized protein n=1 Tax=Guillardia theta (strain CCMP2712) TaxID=905079 RepID=L1ILQ3_GUITC|nr:hypothetical protein GUITHDRAFT_116600 [Guillardia theta CCMP2712]EKX37186.1 hypothetical protein GUITHDRAFT_116600 [Guillardia theta CCMP2712]|eukprot:XP_005824166.1 hypothetical protein GUITHDRAFT_116600 [Guillardia theta CCMP2712]
MLVGRGSTTLRSTRSSFRDDSIVCFLQAPKVGSYSHWSSSVGKTIGAKLNELRIPDTPGPGAYSPNSADKPSAPRYTLSPRHETSNHKGYIPGPGAYTPWNPSHKARAVGFGQRLSYSGDKPRSPGPAAYNVDLSLVSNSGKTVSTNGGKRGAPSYSFGIRHSLGSAYGHVPNTPGPGAYSPTPKAARLLGESVAYSMKSRSPERIRTFAPGPGAYNIDYGCTRRGVFTSPKHSIHGKLKSIDSSNHSTPGPGYYEAPQQFFSNPLP